MPAVAALLVVLASQLGFWALLDAGVFLGALAANVIFWCAAFPAWTVAGRRWWRTTSMPDVSLALTLIALTIVAFWRASQDESDASRDAFVWVGFFDVPLALVATILATLRARAVRRATDLSGAVAAGASLGPKPGTVAAVATVVIALALVVFALLIAVNIRGPR